MFQANVKGNVLNNIAHGYINILSRSDNTKLWLNRSFVEGSLWFTNAVDFFFLMPESMYVLSTWNALHGFSRSYQLDPSPLVLKKQSYQGVRGNFMTNNRLKDGNKKVALNGYLLKWGR